MPETPLVYTIELYTPGEIVSERRSFEAEDLDEAKREMLTWLAISGALRKATNCRLIDAEGSVITEKVIAGMF